MVNRKYNAPWTGITYPVELQNEEAQEKWKKMNCPQGMHLFDEVKSVDHYLHCDACGLCVHIAGVETEEESVARASNDEEPVWLVVNRHSNKL